MIEEIKEKNIYVTTSTTIRKHRNIVNFDFFYKKISVYSKEILNFRKNTFMFRVDIFIAHYRTGPSEYFQFPNLKKWIGGKRFADNEAVKSAVDAYFMGFDRSYHKQGIEAIAYRWRKQIELKEY